jgi:mannose-6-phosphate isomerase-like protein (cupin superfamily)
MLIVPTLQSFLHPLLKGIDMTVYAQPAPAATPIPGLAHVTLAAGAEGLTSLSLWRQAVGPGGCTPPHSHTCDEVVLCEAGEGEVHIDGCVHRFGPHQTIVLPAGSMHQIFNTGNETMVTTGIFSATPVPTSWPDGEPMDLHWRS